MSASFDLETNAAAQHNDKSGTSAQQPMLQESGAARVAQRPTSMTPWLSKSLAHTEGHWTRENMMKYLQEDIEKMRVHFKNPLNPQTLINKSPLAGDGCRVTFKDVTFGIKASDGTTKTILEPVSGHYEPGQMIAIMGPSGCGKSTLLDMLADKKTSKYEGQILINGHPRDHLFQRIAAYVGQEDVMPEHWTVREAIAFNQALKTNADVPQEVADGKIEVVMEAFGLVSVKDTFLGGPKVRGCSGGQRRRVTLARGVASDANLLFLDEPTSGLSATDAQLCIKSLRIMAQRSNLLICVVIHQPRLEVAALFDQLTLLTSNPGRMIYNGPMDQCLPYYKSLGHIVPEYCNPTDFFLDLVTPGSPTDFTDEFVQNFKTRQQPEIDRLVDSQLVVQGTSAEQMLAAKGERMQQAQMDTSRLRFSKMAADRKLQLSILMKRKVSITLRNKEKIVAPILVPSVLGLLMGVMFQGISTKSLVLQIGFFFLVLNVLMLNAFAGLPNNLENRAVMKHETSEKLYSELSFICVNFVIEIPLGIIGSTLQILIMYAFSGLDWKYFVMTWYWGMLVYFVFDSLFGFIGSMAPDMEMAQLMAIPFNCIFLMFSGFMITKKSAPSFLIWPFAISPMYYAIESIVYRIADDNRKPNPLCEKFGEPEFANGTCAHAPKDYPTTNPCKFGCPTQGQAVIDNYGFKGDQTLQGIMIMLTCIVVFRIGQVLALKNMNKIQK